ncbi:hypothetical protein PTSG_11720 [Salpingoeca rosetta]|uniref:CCHC-type domain-containing protein n=1 Tax=Salpingoeca rosetta (strain ATCC 50818 / BSB-021) TaxID=946362 RepID=F2U082_SALR5|nr:uncharacterized protein PTSG_11720 [Salpingoeca rosetta]EGD80810.1 hypothetical protein PTSG_11720 [Salpingoeca rosetta]|eukprot:XP_004997371.1 hypothetical protein PTSG_11720 [Salpingoeca rosetta]
MSDPSDHVVSTPGFKMDLPKFSGSPGTFHAWSIRMKMALKLRGDDVWAAVEAGASSSGGPSSATRSSARRPTAGDHANLTASNLIASTLSGYPLLLFTNGEADVNAGQGWARLKDHYASQDRLRIAELKEAQLHVPCGNLARFFERHMELQQQLQGAGVRQDNEDLFTIVWKQLPRWTAPLTLPYFASGRFPSLLELSIRLQQLEQQMRGSRTQPQAGGFMASAPPRRGGRRGFSNSSNNHGRQGRNNGGNGNSNGKGRRFRGNCHYCGKYGHRAAECRKKQRDNGATGFTAQAQHQHGQDAATFVAATATTPTQLHDPLTWLADTGASHHLTFVKDAFVELSPHLQQHHPRHITAFGGTRVPVRGVGSVLLHARTTSGATMQIVLQECLYVPEGQANLIALGRLTRDSSGRPTGHSQRDGADGHYVRFSHGAEVKLKERNSLRCWPIVAVGPSTAHGLTADACKQPQQPTAAPAAQSKAHTPSMHEVLGHRNDNDVQQYCKLMGIDDRNAISSKQCTTCAVTKSTRHSVSKHAERTQVPGERIHADIVDWTADSPTGKRYSLVITPLQIVTGALPKHVPQLHVFGQPAVVHISTQRGRLQPKGRRGIYVGHNSSSNSHLVYFEDTNTVVSSIHVRFLPFSKADDVVDEGEQVQTSTTSSMLQLPSARDSSNSTTDDASDTEAGAFTASSSGDTSLTEPASIKQALKSQQRKQWTQACLEEIGAMERNGVIKLIPRSAVPRQHTPLKSRFVFKVKRDAEGAPTRFKARWVAKGFSQRPGIDFHQTYAPTPAAKTILTVLAVSLQRQHQLHQLDFKSAYLQADLKEELYMKLPPHFTDIGDGAQRYAGKVCRLLKPLYGLKQAGRAWAKKLHTFLKTNGWAQSNVDACLFTKLHDDGQRTWIITYVDDLIISGSSERHIPDGVLHIAQTQAINDIVNDYNLAAAASVSTPMRVGIDASSISEQPDRRLPFRNLVGSLLYLANRTRPDVSFACGLLCRYMDRYTTVHWQAAKHVVRYLKATSEHGLLFKRRSGTCKDQPLDLYQLTGRSTTGFTCYINGCLVSWSSRLQPTVALSTAEAEYMAISAAAQDVVFLRQLLMDLDEPEAGATKMLTDNQAAIAIGNDHVTKPRTKHIRVRHHFVRELIADGTIVLQHCPGTQMVADALTKALDKQTFEQHLPRLVGTSTAETEQRKAVEGEC